MLAEVRPVFSLSSSGVITITGEAATVATTSVCGVVGSPNSCVRIPRRLTPARPSSTRDDPSTSNTRVRPTVSTQGATLTHHNIPNTRHVGLRTSPATRTLTACCVPCAESTTAFGMGTRKLGASARAPRSGPGGILRTRSDSCGDLPTSAVTTSTAPHECHRRSRSPVSPI